MEYWGLQNQGNSVHSKIKKQLIYAVGHSFIIKRYQLESHEIKLVFIKKKTIYRQGTSVADRYSDKSENIQQS